MTVFMIYLHTLFISSHRFNVWYEFYKDVAELYLDVAEKPISATVQLALFLVGLIGIGPHLSHKLKGLQPLC